MSTGALPVGNVIQVNQNGLVLLGVYTASGGASVDCISRNVSGQSGAIFQSDYDDYEFRLNGLLPATNGVNLTMLMSTDGGATWLAGTTYSYNTSYVTNAGSGGISETSTGAASYFLAGPIDNPSATTVVVGNVEIFNPTSTTRRKGTFAKVEYLQTGNYLIKTGGGAIVTTSALNAAQFKMSSGNVAEGTVLLYGKAKSTTPSAVISQIGRVVQVANFQTGALASGTLAIPIDDTIPQITEGNEFMTLAFTPTSAANKLKITVVVNGAPDTAFWCIAALFQDANVNALASQVFYMVSNGGGCNLTFVHYMTAGTISSTTFRVRAGTSSAGTRYTFNGGTGNRMMGGSMASSITIEEILV